MRDTKRAAELAGKRERAPFGRRRVRVDASKRIQRAHKAPKGGGRGVGRDRARGGPLSGAVKATSDAGFKPS